MTDQTWPAMAEDHLQTPPTTEPADATLIELTARFDAVRIAPTFANAAAALAGLLVFAAGIAVPTPVTGAVVRALEAAIEASREAAVSLRPDHGDSTHIAWDCATALAGYFRVPTEQSSTLNESGVTLDWCDAVCIAANEFDTCFRRDAIQRRAAALRRADVTDDLMNAPPRGFPLH